MSFVDCNDYKCEIASALENTPELKNSPQPFSNDSGYLSSPVCSSFTMDRYENKIPFSLLNFSFEDILNPCAKELADGENDITKIIGK